MVINQALKDEKNAYIKYLIKQHSYVPEQTTTNQPKTLKCKRKLFKKKNLLKKYIVHTLGINTLEESIIKPDNLEEMEFLAIQTLEFYNQIQMLNSCISDKCVAKCTSSMTAGDRYEFLWKSPGQSKPRRCPAQEYIINVLHWTEELIDTTIMVDPLPATSEMMNNIKKIFKRFFRFYAHVYYTHLKDLQNQKMEEHFNSAFKHFWLFVKHYDLVDDKELMPLNLVIDQFNIKQ